MDRDNKNGFKIVTVGWEPRFIDYFFSSLSEKVDINFIHGIVGDDSRIDEVERKYPQLKFLSLSKTTKESLPVPDYELLASLECVGVSTIRSMVQGDRVLRHLPANEAFAYATLLAGRMRAVFKKHHPDVVLASFDSLHAAMSLAVAKSLGIPWVAMAFTVIPVNLTGFCRGLTPDKLVPIQRIVNDQLREQAMANIKILRSKEHKVLAFRPPLSIYEWVIQYLQHAKNLFRRIRQAKSLGMDKYTYPSAKQRLNDITRRLVNRLRLPGKKMLQSPPQGRFVYYPLHMLPESSVDTWAPFYQNQIAFVEQLSLSIPADTAFVIKLHFSDPDNYSREQLEQLMRLPRLYVAHPNAPGNVFIEKAGLVVGIQGTACLEAALLGKPVLIFGDSPYQHFPRTEYAKRPDELYGQIRRMLDQTPATDDEVVEAYAAYLARYMPGRINDWNKPIEEEDIEKLAECFRRLRSFVEELGSRADWYNVPPFVSVQPSKPESLPCQF